ncbi:MAG: Flp pilus assembly complex ATPase component TadA [Candidatus Thorarchaeota archaeon]|nr:Flp pilus assembly complex ATPase component TadA [Candidatus Thorarchaeota archaeon]
MLESQNLTFSYDGKTQILRSIDLQIRQGEIVVLTGPTGSGKSTLAKCLSGFIPRSIEGEFSGEIIIDNEDTSDYSVAEISRLVSLVQQDPDSQICTLKVSDEVAFGPENYEFELKSIEKLVESSLFAVGASHLRNRSTHTLSGGEKQRLAIASMLSCQPKYLILDEPSASLDPKGILLLRKILSGLKDKNVGVLCIEHNIDAIRPVADRILSISNGTITDWNKMDAQTITKPTKTSVQENTPLLTLERANFSYGSTQVIHDISLTIHQREVIALMGGNGSGKTTLVSLLGGLLEPDNGRVDLGRVAISDIDRKEIAKRISVVFQNPNHQIFERTVWKEQILTSEILNEIHEASIERSTNLLNSVNLGTFLNRNPFSLSHGQKRRLNITSSIAHVPSILLLDEPFIGQDQEGREFISNIIVETACANGAALVVTHNPNFANNYCNRVIFIENGSILLDGSPDTVLQRLEEIGHSEYSEIGVSS